MKSVLLIVIIFGCLCFSAQHRNPDHNSYQEGVYYSLESALRSCEDVKVLDLRDQNLTKLPWR